MFSLKLLALVGIVLLVAASTIALWPAPAPAEEKIADIGPDQEIVQAAAATPEVGSGFSFDAGKPTSEGIVLDDSVTATSVQAIGNGPLKVTLANVVTGQNLIALANGEDRDVVAEFEVDMIVENTGGNSLAYATFDRFIVLDGTRIAAEKMKIDDLEGNEKVTVQDLTTITAAQIPSILRESVKQRLQAGSAPTFSIEVANLDFARY